MEMKNLSSFFSLSLLLSAQPLLLVAHPAALPAEEEKAHNSFGDAYINVSKDRSKLAEIAAEISALDADKDSPICQLNRHITQGHMIALKDAVLETLAYAESVLERQGSTMSPDRFEQINDSLNDLARDIESGNLSVNVVDQDFSRDSNPIIKIREKLYVLDRAKFFDDVTFKDEVTFDDAVTFNGDVAISGTLSAADQVVGCDLTVGCNISMNDSTSADIGNIIKDGSPFIHTYPAGSNNTFVGTNAGNFTATGTGNSGFGYNALQTNSSGEANTASGFRSLASNTTGSSNTAYGFVALESNTTGTGNTACGIQSLIFNTIGGQNAAFGAGALFNNISGSGNTALGVSTLDSNIDGNNNIAIGINAGNGLTSGSDNIHIANQGLNETGVIRIGTTSTQTSCYIAGINGVTTGLSAVPVVVDANGQLGTVSSSKRFKHDISAMAADSEIIYQLNPVTFAFNGDVSETKQYGLIAEEVDQVFSNIVIKDEEGNPYTVQYQVLPVLMLNEMIKQHAAIERQNMVIEQQNTVIEDINNRLIAVERN